MNVVGRPEQFQIENSGEAGPIYYRQISDAREPLGEVIHALVSDLKLAVASFGHRIAAITVFQLRAFFADFKNKHCHRPDLAMRCEMEAVGHHVSQHLVQYRIVVGWLFRISFDMEAVGIEPVWSADDLVGAT